MAAQNQITPLTPQELKRVQDFLKKESIDVQIRFNPQRIRRMEDGGFVIDPPQFQTGFVKIVKQPAPTNGENKAGGNLQVS